MRRAIGGDPQTLDPQRAGDSFSFEVLRDLYEGLTEELPSGESAPGAAIDWRVSQDGTRYTFEMRADGKWSDGSGVTANDFVRGFRRAVDPATRAPGASLLNIVRGAPEIIAGAARPETLGVFARGPLTLEIDLSAPAPYFTSILANAIAYPAHDGPATHAGAVNDVVSNGPYRLVKWVPGSALTLEKSSYYWDARHVPIAHVEYDPIADASTEFVRYRANALDMTSSVPSAEFERLKRELPAELQSRPQLAVVYYVFNLDRAPFRGAPGLREALSLAIDRERITDGVLRAGQVPAYSFVPPGMPGYTRAEYNWRTQAASARLTRARALYAAAGFSESHPLRLRLLCPEDDSLRKVALAISAMWKEALGVEATPVYLEYRAFLATRDQRDQWDVASHGWNADYADPGNFLEIFKRGSPQNDPRLDDPDLDRRLAAIAAEADGARRLAQLSDAERRLLDSYAIAPVYFPVSRRLVKPRVAGAVLAPMNHNYSKFLSIRAE